MKSNLTPTRALWGQTRLCSTTRRPEHAESSPRETKASKWITKFLEGQIRRSARRMRHDCYVFQRSAATPIYIGFKEHDVASFAESPFKLGRAVCCMAPDDLSDARSQIIVGTLSNINSHQEDWRFQKNAVFSTDFRRTASLSCHIPQIFPIPTPCPASSPHPRHRAELDAKCHVACDAFASPDCHSCCYRRWEVFLRGWRWMKQPCCSCSSCELRALCQPQTPRSLRHRLHLLPPHGGGRNN